MALKKNVSGQYLYLALVGVSGAVTGASGQISGRKSLDGLSGMIVLSGNIIELGGGSYRANLYDFDTNGDYAGYLFTSSGAAPVQYSMVTLGGESGFIYPASGVNVTVPPSSISGTVVNSGLFVTVPISTISGVQPISGATVTVPIASISGAIVNSGLSVTVPIASISGVNSVADVRFWSGSLVASGLAGVPVVGTAVTNQDGFAQSGTTTAVQFDSTASTTNQLYVGRSITLTTNTGAGQASIITAYSGGAMKIATVSPAFTTAPLSGTAYVWGEPLGDVTGGGGGGSSGLFVTVPISTISGLNAVVPPATISGTMTRAVLASGEATYRLPYNVLSFDFTNFSGLIASGLSGRCAVNAERKLTNKWSLTDASGYLRVYQEDDVTVAYDQAVTSISGGQPISSLDTK